MSFREGISAMFAAHSMWLSAFLRGLTRNEADAADAFQETWMRIIRSNGPAEGKTERAYLAQVARSVVVDNFRKGWRYELSVDACDDDGVPVCEKLVDDSPDAAEAFQTRASKEEIRNAVRALPEGPRQVLLMRIEGELSFHEIAEELGVPLGTALTWMRSATMRLKKELGEIR